MVTFFFLPNIPNEVKFRVFVISVRFWVRFYYFCNRTWLAWLNTPDVHWSRRDFVSQQAQGEGNQKSFQNFNQNGNHLCFPGVSVTNWQSTKGIISPQPTTSLNRFKHQLPLILLSIYCLCLSFSVSSVRFPTPALTGDLKAAGIVFYTLSRDEPT